MRALIGLGNPGRQYALTRHNIGFIFLDFIQQKHNIPFNPGKGDYYFAETGIAQEDVLLVKPVTYMNRSGLAVAQALEHFDLLPEDVLIIYDDFHLPFGVLRFRARGSAGGHNGMESVIYHLQSEEIRRLRIGVGQPVEDDVDFVLSNFTEKEQEALPDILKATYDGIKTWLKYGMNEAMNRYNRQVLSSNTNQTME